MLETIAQSGGFFFCIYLLTLWHKKSRDAINRVSTWGFKKIDDYFSTPNSLPILVKAAMHLSRCAGS